MNVAVVLVAAGNGERLGAGIPKALVKVGGKSLLEHALISVQEFNPAQLVVVAHEDHLAEFEEQVSANYEGRFAIAPGGNSRQGSVANGLALVTEDLVLVHDAARCFASAQLFRNVANALSESVVVIPVMPVADTVKRVSGSKILGTEDRSALRLAQTPQGFRTALLKTAISETSEDFTDEAALMQSLGFEVESVIGEATAFKVTTAADLDRARGDFGARATGIGTDAHRFSESGELVLGCLMWPELPKLEGHSDGDSIAHAIVDALLSAAKLGDIGSNFGVDRPEFAGASGEVFITETLKMISAKGYLVENVAVQVIADKPKIGPRRFELEARLSQVVGAPVSVGATTTDGLGFLADSRGVAAVATALLKVLG
ncbi:MAG: 2-C-methyl-D-erythritol 4-phosphate cytidylyltransferase [Actinomycetota bacterium]|jgi:2-C-methyl-D-erythritol 4-phosphate cytidylyltransferase/2-C-methyl-D-erythritol 2,4-cyclodiphosphate synthase